MCANTHSNGDYEEKQTNNSQDPLVNTNGVKHICADTHARGDYEERPDTRLYTVLGKVNYVGQIKM